MKKLIIGTILIIAIVGMLLSAGCGQYGARNFGGTKTEKLPPNEKLIMITWKDSQLWYLTRPMTSEDQAITYEFKESSLFGLMEGKINLVEVKE